MVASVTTAALTVAAGGVAGLVAAVAMDLPMSRQPDGFAPAYVAAAALTRGDPESVSTEAALAVHHAAGVLAGVLYALALVGAGAVAPPGPSVAGVALLPHVVAVGFVVAFIYAFFAHLVLPRSGGSSYERRATAVRGQWLRSARTFGAALLLIAPALVGALAGG